MKQAHTHHDETDSPYEQPVRRNIGKRSSDMNVTPLIDVLLVLLVIFMATLPLTQKGMDINLPLETRAVSTPAESTQVVLARAADGKVTLNTQAVDPAELRDRLEAIFAGRKDKTIFVQGAASLHYGDMVPLIDVATSLGLRVGIITTGMEEAARRQR